MDTKVKCEICFKEYKSISVSHLNKHDISMEDYKNRFPNAILVSEEKRLKVSETLKTAHKTGKIINYERTAEIRYKISKSLTGHTQSIQTKQKRAIALKGQKRNELQKQHISNGIKKAFKENPELGKQASLARKTAYEENPEYREKVRLAKIGSKNPMWNENREQVYAPYTEKFRDVTYRKQILKDQNSQCFCGKPQEERTFHLHHIDYNKRNDLRENLIFLCPSCHPKTNASRNKWQIKLSEINKSYAGEPNA